MFLLNVENLSPFTFKGLVAFTYTHLSDLFLTLLPPHPPCWLLKIWMECLGCTWGPPTVPSAGISVPTSCRATCRVVLPSGSPSCRKAASTQKEPPSAQCTLSCFLSKQGLAVKTSHFQEVCVVFVNFCYVLFFFFCFN